ncbi:hypothetical protein SMB93_003590 [Cronobacter sakazakii]|nr:hypothetical protein [Cronobacter sakazakii]
MSQSLPYYEILTALLEQYGPATRKEIASKTGMTTAQVGRTVSYCVNKGLVRVEDGRVVLSEGLFGPCVDAKTRGPGNMIFKLCKRNWRGYEVHQLLNACRRASA